MFFILFLRLLLQSFFKFTHDVREHSGREFNGCVFYSISCVITSFTCSKRMRIISIKRVRFHLTVLRQMKVYLLASDSSFIPSIYSRLRLIKLFLTRIRINGVNTLFSSFFIRLRKRLMVIKSESAFPESQIQ